MCPYLFGLSEIKQPSQNPNLASAYTQENQRIRIN
jgi:hypothetical protein